jgi:hypothetical protein
MGICQWGGTLEEDDDHKRGEDDLLTGKGVALVGQLETENPTNSQQQPDSD